MILESIEMDLHTPKTGAVTFDEKLTIEHIMPVEWERHWPIESDDDFETEKLARRCNIFIHRIGNLTLLTKSVNPPISNGAWHKKRDGLNPSLLLLNQALKDANVWSEREIDNRSASLFVVASNLWKYPSEASSATCALSEVQGLVCLIAVDKADVVRDGDFSPVIPKRHSRLTYDAYSCCSRD